MGTCVVPAQHNQALAPSEGSRVSFQNRKDVEFIPEKDAKFVEAFGRGFNWDIHN